MAVTLEARVKQKKDTLENWMANPLPLLDGELGFVVGVNDTVPMIYKIGDGVKTFAELPFPDFTVKGKSVPSDTWPSSKPSGVYIPTANGVYNGVEVDLGQGYTTMYWDGLTLVKMVSPGQNIDAFVFKGNWDAATNTPFLQDGEGVTGNFYLVSVAGSHNFGHGSISFQIGDRVMYGGGLWTKSPQDRIEAPTPSNQSFIIV